MLATVAVMFLRTAAVTSATPTSALIRAAHAAQVRIAMGLRFPGWLKALPPRTRCQVVLAGGLYVGSAVGIEAVEGAIYRSSLGPGLLYAMTTTIEEGLELVGITVFIAALLRLQQEQPARSSLVDHR
jgi:hypothetical protein